MVNAISRILCMALLFSAATAFGATRTVCLQLIIPDERYDCPSSGTGVRKACNPTGVVNPEGHDVVLWDKDPGTGSADDYIGLWMMGPGLTCMTFEWEGASYSMGEANPDIYFEVRNRVRATNSDELIRIVDDSGNFYEYPTSRNGWGGNSDAGTAVDCAAGTTCYIAGGGGVYITNNAASNYGQALMALDSAQRTLAIYHTHLHSGPISIEYPDTSGVCPTACASGRNDIIIPAGLAADGFRAAHEVGHMVHKNEFMVDALRDDCSFGASSWTMTGYEFESCVVAEGFASYVAAVSWWNPSVIGAAPVGFGGDIDSATPTNGTCANNGFIPLQAAKAFWDLDDATNEAGVGAAAGFDDVVNLSTLSIAAGWSNFASGFANRENQEASANGVNLYDYDFNHNVNNETLLNHNCMAGQVP